MFHSRCSPQIWEYEYYLPWSHRFVPKGHSPFSPSTTSSTNWLHLKVFFFILPNFNTVDGSEILHQLRLVVSPILYLWRVVYIPGGCLGFLNHQLYQFNPGVLAQRAHNFPPLSPAPFREDQLGYRWMAIPPTTGSAFPTDQKLRVIWKITMFNRRYSIVHLQMLVFPSTS